MEATRRVRYQVAASLDGFIADASGGADWIVGDSDIDFNALFAQFDTFLMGRRTYEGMPAGGMPGGRVLVFSRTMRQEEHPGVQIVASNERAVIEELKSQPGKDIWLFGGGQLFSNLLEQGLVDSVEIAVIPVLLGSGVPLAGAGVMTQRLTLTNHRLYPKSGIIMLEYAVGAKKERGRKPALSSAV